MKFDTGGKLKALVGWKGKPMRKFKAWLMRGEEIIAIDAGC